MALNTCATCGTLQMFDESLQFVSLTRDSQLARFPELLQNHRFGARSDVAQSVFGAAAERRGSPRRGDCDFLPLPARVERAHRSCNSELRVQGDGSNDSKLLKRADVGNRTQ
jgi:hypothetical protein